MRVAVTGTTGRVGAALACHLAQAGKEVVPLPRQVCDLADPASLDRCLNGLECDAIINPAGITGLDECEENPRLAMTVNSAAPGKIALWAAERGVRMIHFSTDYVFAGDTTVGLTEGMPARPVNAYGRSKLAGERAVLAQPGHLVIRVSWIFGPEKPSFVDQVFDAAIAGKPLAAIADKLSLPTFTGDLARWVDRILATSAEGILHACNSGDAVSWHGIATFVVGEMCRHGTLASPPVVVPQSLADASFFRATRPRFTAMDNHRLATILGSPPRSWREAMADYVANRCANR